MNILSAVGSAAKFLFGSGATSPVETVAKVADEFKFTAQEQAEAAAAGVAGARQYEPSHMPGVTPIAQQGFIFFFLEWVLRLLNLLVDAVIHLIRPWVTVQLIGGLFGYWQLPDVSGLHPFYVSMIDVVLVFWFGARVITKDLPALIMAWAAMKQKGKA